MEFPTWFWDTAIGILGISGMFLFIMLGNKKKGLLGKILFLVGVIVGGALLVVATDHSLIEKIF